MEDCTIVIAPVDRNHPRRSCLIYPICKRRHNVVLLIPKAAQTASGSRLCRSDVASVTVSRMSKSSAAIHLLGYCCVSGQRQQRNNRTAKIK